jgi:hypothetical protein
VFSEFYLANLVFCRLLKDMSSKKNELISNGHNLLVKHIYLTFIRNLREKQYYIYALPPFENLYREYFSILYFFALPPSLATR